MSVNSGSGRPTTLAESQSQYAPLRLNEGRADMVRKYAPALPPTDQNAPTKPAAPKSRSLPVEFCLGGAATSTAVLFTNPIEVVKTRMQVQGEVGDRVASTLGAKQPRQYKNMFDAFVKIASNEGIAGLQGGLLPAMGYQVMMNGTRLGMYAPLQRLYTGWFGQQLEQRPVDAIAQQVKDGKPVDVQKAMRPNILINVAAGTTSGVAGAFVGSPFFLMKVRLQTLQIMKKAVAATPAGANSVAAQQQFVGAQHNVTGTISGLSQIWKTEGIKGWFRGVQAAMLRVGLGSGVQLSTYDNNKHLLIKHFGFTDGVPAHFAASMVTGMIVTLVMNPADVVSTRMYNQPVDAVTKQGKYYKSLFECFSKTMKTEGPLAFYKGVVPHYLRLGPHTILTFVFWEQTKRMANKFGI